MARVTNQCIQLSQAFFDPQALLKACAERKMEGIASIRVDRPPCRWSNEGMGRGRHEFSAKQR